METYLFKFSTCLAVFWLVYILFLERQTMHRFKRLYLLVAIASAIVIPTITITEYVEPTPLDFEVSTLYVPFQPSLIEQPQVQAPFYDLETILWILYGLGVLVFAVRFVVNLYKMYKRISAHEQIEKRPFIYVLLEECRIPHSFFKYLFFERFKYETDTIPDEVKLHEETHAKQLHSLDIIAIELLQIVFWFHPLIYILKHHIKLNHEFLADQAVLDDGIDTKAYQKTLLQFSSNAYEYQLSSTINYSSIKKRFTVMKTQTSKTKMWLSSFLLIPIIAILFYSFAEKEYVEKDNNLDIIESIKNESIEAEKYRIQNVEEAPEKLMKEYRDFIENFERTNIIRSNTYERAYTIYNDLMSNEQRRSVKPLPKLPKIDLTDVNAKSPAKSEFDSWKNASEYALWLDGSPIPNSKLNTLSPNEIKYYTGSFVNLNARSAKYPKPYQVQLYTEKGFKGTYQESNIKKYNALTKQYTISLNNYLQGLEIEHSDLKILKARIDKLYNSFPEQELKDYSILPAPPVPAQKQEIATAKQVAAYNTWAKSINQQMAKAKASNVVNAYPIVKVKEVNTYKAIYAIMTEDQKEASEAWPNYPPPPPPPPTPKETKGVPIEINGANYYFTQQNGKTTYYDNYGNAVDINKIPPPPPIPNDATPEQKAKMKKATDAYMKANPDKVGKAEGENGEIIEIVEIPDDLQGSLNINGETFYYTTSNGNTRYFNRFGKEVKMDNLPPPPPSVPVASEKSISSNNAQKSILPLINGKKIASAKLSMTTNEFKAIKLSTQNGEVTEFKIKIPGVKTEFIKGNIINQATIANLKSMSKGSTIAIFDIKDNNNIKIAPITIEITD